MEGGKLFNKFLIEFERIHTTIFVRSWTIIPEWSLGHVGKIEIRLLLGMINVLKHIRNFQLNWVNISQLPTQFLQAIIIAIANYRCVVVIKLKSNLSLHFFREFIQYAETKYATSTADVYQPFSLACGLEPIR